MNPEEKLWEARRELARIDGERELLRKALRQLRPYAELVDNTRARESMTSIIVNALEES